eukprot:COSAG05_NODE_9668_length_608_cov_3.357850_1_plen_121_part_01
MAEVAVITFSWLVCSLVYLSIGISQHWDGLCNFHLLSPQHRYHKYYKRHSVCNIPFRSHSWKSPVQADPGFVCGKCISNCELMRSAELNSVSATITLDTDIATIKPGSSSRKAFESAFTTD